MYSIDHSPGMDVTCRVLLSQEITGLFHGSVHYPKIFLVAFVVALFLFVFKFLDGWHWAGIGFALNAKKKLKMFAGALRFNVQHVTGRDVTRGVPLSQELNNPRL